MEVRLMGLISCVEPGLEFLGTGMIVACHQMEDKSPFWRDLLYMWVRGMLSSTANS